MSSLSVFNSTPNASSNSAIITATGKIAKTYIQDFTKAMCESQASSASKTVYDKRDEKDYQVRYINGNCWMVQNLRYVGDSGSASGSMIMKSATSNIGTDTTISYTDLTMGNTYDAARLHVATSGQVPSGATYTATDMGVWYNYAAASAMTITGSNNTGTQTYDICPKNWRLPTSSEYSGITSSMSAFFDDEGAITGGYYDGKIRNGPGRGYWWSSTPNSSYSSSRSSLLYDGKLSTYRNGRTTGIYVRCIRSA